MYQNPKTFAFSRNNVLSQKGRRNGGAGAQTQGNVSKRGITYNDMIQLNTPNNIKVKINAEKDKESIQGFRTFRQ
jgi:hypothetical protein